MCLCLRLSLGLSLGLGLGLSLGLRRLHRLHLGMLRLGCQLRLLSLGCLRRLGGCLRLLLGIGLWRLTLGRSRGRCRAVRSWAVRPRPRMLLLRLTRRLLLLGLLRLGLLRLAGPLLGLRCLCCLCGLLLGLLLRLYRGELLRLLEIHVLRS